MGAKTIYRNNWYKDQILNLYDEFVECLPGPVDEGYVDTVFGQTHYLSIGPEDGEVIINFHGGNSIASHGLLPLVSLANKYRVIAPDIVGQPGKSAENKLNPKSLDHGKWASEFIDRLGYQNVNCIGSSFGGGVLLHMAATCPQLIKKAVFAIPTGFVRSSTLDNLKIFGPGLIKYKLKKTDNNLKAIIQPLVEDTSLIDPLELKLFRFVFDGLKLSTGMPRPVRRDELERFTAACMIAVAELDVMCPAQPVLRKARELGLSINKELIFHNRPHMVTSYSDSMECFCDSVDSFFSTVAETGK